MNNGDGAQPDGPGHRGDDDARGDERASGFEGRDLKPASPADTARLRAMVDTHFEAVWRALRRLGVSPMEMDDCAQHVFLVASRKLSVIVAGSEQAFLMGTAVRVASDHRRAQGRRREVPDDGSLERVDPGPQPDELAEQKRMRALLDEVLAGMPEDERVVFVMFELEELSTQEIAGILAIPAGTVASRLRRAREEFDRRVARLNLRGGKR